MVVHAFNPSPQKPEQVDLFEFEDSQGFTEKFCLKETKPRQNIKFLGLRRWLSW